MSITLMSKAFKAWTETPAQKLVLLKLADYANDEGDSIYPSKVTVGKQCRLDRRTVQRIMGVFEETGLLIKVRERLGSPTQYRLDIDLLDRLMEFDGKGDAPRSKAKPVEGGAAADRMGRETAPPAASDHTHLRQDAAPTCGVRPPNPSEQPPEQPPVNHQDVEASFMEDGKVAVLDDVPAFAADWPVLHVSGGDYEIKEPYASSEEIRTGVIEWLTHRAADKKKGMPTVFAMQRNNCGWWDKYPVGAIEHAVNRAAGGKWIGIIEDIAREWKPNTGKDSSIKGSVQQSVQNMANMMEQRQAMIRAAAHQQPMQQLPQTVVTDGT